MYDSDTCGFQTEKLHSDEEGGVWSALVVATRVSTSRFKQRLKPTTPYDEVPPAAITAVGIVWVVCIFAAALEEFS